MKFTQGEKCGAIAFMIVVMMFYLLFGWIDAAAERKSYKAQYESMSKINQELLITIDELRADKEARNNIIVSEYPTLPGINGMEAPTK